jgi:hypothetical protein
MNIKNADMRIKLDGDVELLLTVNADKNHIGELIRKANEKPYTVEIAPLKKKRSLDANGYLWVLLQKIAEALHTSKDEIYLEMLARYGVFTHIVVKPNVVERVKDEWRTVRELGEVTINGKTGIQLQCFFGSSTYDSKEFSVLLDGVISEAKELGIETLSETEADRMIKEWGK